MDSPILPALLGFLLGSTSSAVVAALMFAPRLARIEVRVGHLEKGLTGVQHLLEQRDRRHGER